jgi:A/G-specific adenine glycosylase
VPIPVPPLRRALLTWYRRVKRDYPWRLKPDLYRTLVAEFMLQQTRTDQALPYYRRFLREFPSMRKLAAAKQQDVLKAWEGLGYYRRADHLHRAAQHLATLSKVDLADLEEVPGIGPYTYAAIGSIVFSQPLPVVDGNVRRVMARVLTLEEPPENPTADDAIRRHLKLWISRRSPANFNQAMMELGATVCTPRNPRCHSCPLAAWCRARKTGRQQELPVRRATKRKPHHQIAAAVIRRNDGRILIAQRLASGLLPNLWEFPGGKQERGESLPTCCRREIREELDVDIHVGPKMVKVDHSYSHYSVTLHFFDCLYLKGKPKTLGCQAFRWVKPSELSDYPFPRANWPVVEELSGG